ncbi:MAG: glycosyltransferase [Candidatus Omnitrophica bacterium]|nr:glycosyltransferase [Candidatus Omnitrophota bacterium]
MKKRKILLMYISKVSGHRQATMAISKSLKRFLPDAEVMSINGFGYNYPLLEHVVNAAYMTVIKHTPKVWDYMYDNPKVVKRSANLRKFLNKSSHAKLEKLFKEFPADTVICSQAFPCSMVADYKASKGLKFNLIGTLTDYAPHSYWINDGVDHYVVPSDDTMERFVKKGVPAEKIRAFGIPIRYNFAQKLDKKAVRAKLGLDPNVPVVLVMGGGQGLGPMKDAVKNLLKIPAPVQLIVVCGANQKLHKWLVKNAAKASKKIVYYDYANNVDELMEAAHLIVTKPGGMTTSECLVKGLPMVIVNPLPGQEERNADFLLEKGIAVRVHDLMDLADEVEILLKSPEHLSRMSRAAYDNGKPNAADDIARLVAGFPAP